MDLPQNPIELARKIDLTVLKPDAVRGDFERYCTVARELKLHGICVHGSRVLLAAAFLEESDVKIITMAGFPTGANDSDTKRYETEAAADNGAHEIELAINLGWLKEREDARIVREIRDVVEAADERPVGVIIESELLNRDEKLRLAEIISEAGAQSVVLGTELLSEAPPSMDDIKMLREVLEAKISIKAAGRIPDSKTALALLQAGAARLAISEPALLLGDA